MLCEVSWFDMFFLSRERFAVPARRVCMVACLKKCAPRRCLKIMFDADDC
jgi:hypothetical protein